MKEVILPRTSDEVTESVVILWYKSVGDRVQAHDALVEVQTEKATFEVEAPVTGVLSEILVKRAQTAAVGDVLAVIEEGEGPVQDASASKTAASTDSLRPAVTSRFVQAPPRMRRLAAEVGVDLATVQGTGVNGRITEADVRAVAESGHTAHPRIEADQMLPGEDKTAMVSISSAAVRKITARRMTNSLRESAQLTLHAWADVTELAQHRETSTVRAGWNTWILCAVAKALADHPDMNARWTDSGVELYSSIGIGVAVDTEFGLLVPVLADADGLSLRDLQNETNRLAKQAREGELPAAAMDGGTFTVTNLGPYGVAFFTPILYPGQAGILGVGAIEDTVVPIDDRLEVRRRLPLSLTFDHRVMDGGPAARYLQAVAENLARPEELA